MDIKSTVLWIDAIETKPPEDQMVLASNSKRAEFCVWNGKNFVCPDINYLCLDATHWAEIPKVPEVLPMTLPEYVKETGIPLTKIAAKCSISYGQLYRIMQGKCTTLDNAIRIQKFTGGRVRPTELLPKKKMQKIESDIASSY